MSAGAFRSSLRFCRDLLLCLFVAPLKPWFRRRSEPALTRVAIALQRHPWWTTLVVLISAHLAKFVLESVLQSGALQVALVFESEAEWLSRVELFNFGIMTAFTAIAVLTLAVLWPVAGRQFRRFDRLAPVALWLAGMLAEMVWMYDLSVPQLSSSAGSFYLQFTASAVLGYCAGYLLTNRSSLVLRTVLIGAAGVWIVALTVLIFGYLVADQMPTPPGRPLPMAIDPNALFGHGALVVMTISAALGRGRVLWLVALLFAVASAVTSLIVGWNTTQALLRWLVCGVPLLPLLLLLPLMRTSARLQVVPARHPIFSDFGSGESVR